MQVNIKAYYIVIKLPEDDESVLVLFGARYLLVRVSSVTVEVPLLLFGLLHLFVGAENPLLEFLAPSVAGHLPIWYSQPIIHNIDSVGVANLCTQRTVK